MGLCLLRSEELALCFLCFVQDVEIDIELAPGDQTSTPKTKELSEKDIGNQLHMLTNRHDKFLDTLREVKTGALLSAFVQLCHISTTLAEKTWVQLFPRLWKILSDRQQHVSQILKACFRRMQF